VNNKKIKRYTVDCILKCNAERHPLDFEEYDLCTHVVGMTEYSKGDWVRWEDVRDFIIKEIK